MNSKSIWRWSAAMFCGAAVAVSGYWVLAQVAENPPTRSEYENDRPPKPRPSEKEDTMKVTGKIARFHENPHGDVDGAFLDNDTEIKFPPHMGKAVQELVSVGDEVSVEGKRHVTPKGDVHVRSDVISAHGKSLEIDHPRGPRPPHEGPGGEDWMTKGQADEVIKELRAIRKLLEARSSN